MKLTTIYWRDIPAQVKMKEGRKRAKALLSDRFQEGIDTAAMRAKAVDEDAYLEDWRNEDMQVQGDSIDEIVQQRAKQLEAEYDDERLTALIKNKGYAVQSEA